MATHFRKVLLCSLFVSGLVAEGAEKSATQSAPSPSPRVFLHDAQHLEVTRQRIRNGDKSLAPAMDKLEQDAQKALSAGPFSVTFKAATPPSGDKHDYMSQAPYFWPDPDKPGGLPYIRRDGERNPEINKFPDHRVKDEMEDAV